jgi:4-amino-4-deoxy-L-arabinose transferase-like glycosyltransferase
MRTTSEIGAAEPRETAPSAPQSLRALLLALCVAVFALQILRIDADTPVKLGSVRFDAGAFCDEGYKTLDARNRVLFGTEHWTPEDQYAGWAERSPVSVELDTLVFRLFGVELRNVRLLSLAFAIASAALFAWLLTWRFGRLSAALGVLLLAIHPLFVVYGRLALFEIKVLFFSLAGLAALLIPRPWPGWVRWPVGVLAFALAWGAKETAVFGLAALAIAWILLRTSAELTSVVKRRVAIWGLVLAAVVVLALLERFGVVLRLRGRELSSLVGFGRELFMLDVLRMNPLLTLLGTVASVLVLRRLVTRAPPPRTEDVLMVSWFWVQTLTFTVFNYHPSRYYLVALPGLLWLALLALREAHGLHEELFVRPGGLVTILLGLVLSVGFWHLATSSAVFVGLLHPRNSESKQFFLARFGAALLASWPVLVAGVLFLGGRISPGGVRRALVGLLALAAALNLWMFAAWMAAPRYELRAGSAQMKTLPPDSVLVGDWAPELTLDTSLRTLYLTWDNLHRLRRIKPTHVVVMRRANPLHREQIDQLFPGARSAEPELRFPYANDTVEVYRFSLLW